MYTRNILILAHIQRYEEGQEQEFKLVIQRQNTFPDEERINTEREEGLLSLLPSYSAEQEKLDSIYDLF